MKNRLKIFLYISLLGFFLILTGCKEDKTVTIAEVGDATVTEAEYLLEWEKRPRSENTEGARQHVLDGLIYRNALRQAAVEKGLLDDPEVKHAVNQILISRLKERELFPRLEAMSVTEEEALDYYEANKQTLYVTPESKQVAVLWFDTRGQKPLEMRYQNRLQTLIDSGNLVSVPVEAGFGSFSVKHSEHAASRYRGGRIGTIKENANANTWLKAVAEISKTLSAPGALSELVVREEGIFLVRLVSLQSESIRSFDSVRRQIVRHLEQEKRKQIEDAFRAEVLAQLKIKVDHEQLMTMELPTAPEHGERKAFLASSLSK